MFTMVVVAMSIFMTVFTLHMNYRGPTTHKMRPWMRRVFTEILPRILLLKRPEPRRKPNVAVRTCNGIEFRETYTVARDWSRYRNIPPPCAGRLSHPHHRPTRLLIDDQNINRMAGNRYVNEVQDVIEGVKYIANRMQAHDQHAEVSL